MLTSGTDYPKWTGIGVAVLWRLALILGFFAMAIWLWPAGLLETPLTELTPWNFLCAVVSVAFLSVGITSLYLVVVDPFVQVYSDPHTRDRN
jgi:hypothetical protein